MKLFSNKLRPVHFGPYPLERLVRTTMVLHLPTERKPRTVPKRSEHPLRFSDVADAYIDLLDQWQDGTVAPEKAPISEDALDLTQQMKAASYFMDTAMVGACEIPEVAWFTETESGETVTPYHHNALVIVVEHVREPELDNLASEWLRDAQSERAAVRAAEIAVTIAGYIRHLGWHAKSHSADKSDLDHELLTVCIGLGRWQNGRLVNQLLVSGFGTAVVSCDMPVQPDLPLVETPTKPERDWRFQWGMDGAVSERERERHRRRPSHLSKYPMETIRKVPHPTTLVLEDEVPRVPKRAAFFERARKGDLGAKTQVERNRFVIKHPFTMGMVPMIRGLVPHQDGAVAAKKAPNTDDSSENAKAIKSLSYFLNVDLIGICEAKRFTWFSHDDDGKPIKIRHRHAIVMLIDQGYETMEGASGDDWISGAQSMRSYLRGATIGGQMAEFIRRLGYSARVHSNLDSEVLHIPLILYAGLGELSRIGELVLNPFVGPRFKSVVVTTDISLTHDQPIDFGLQDICAKSASSARGSARVMR